MKCKEYIFRLTSGQLSEASLLDRALAVQHRLICRRCRAFTRNDAQLDAIVQDYREYLAQPGETTAREQA